VAVLRIGHRCPQCGAPVTLEETDRLLSCDYCRVRLYITSAGHLRYSLPAKAGSAEGLLMAPYWRFRGMQLSLAPYNVKSRVLDASFLAAGHDFLPESLGVRPQGLKLAFAAGDSGAGYLPLSRSLEDVMRRIGALCSFNEAVTGEASFYSAFVGEAVSVIYFPLYVRGNAIYDAILDRPLARRTLQRAEEFERAGPGGCAVNFLPALCPDCGWDLEGERDSVALLCRNCDSFWSVGKDGLDRVPYVVYPSSALDTVHVPFWRMEGRVEGLEAGSYLDLVRIANLPVAPRREWRDRPLYFWSPAFRAAPRVFMRLARQMTMLQPGGQNEEATRCLRLYPVTLGSAAAAEGLKVILASVAAAKRKVFPAVADAEVSCKSSTLVFLPFVARGQEFIETEMGLSIPQNALRRAMSAPTALRP
jgi:hypothetical protein